MNKTHRILSVLLASIVFLSGVDLTPLFSNAAVNYETATFYVIDVAVQYDSSNSGMKSDISVSYTLPSNYEPLRGARNIQIKDRAALYDFDSPQHGMEMKDNEYILKSSDWSNSSFKYLYEPFTSSRLSFTQQIQLSGTTFSYKYSASKAYAAYSGMDANRLEAYSILREPNGVQTLKNTLFNHDGQIRLLGDETAYARDYRENYQTIQEAIDNYDKPAYADRKLYITFQPTIFSFTCEVPREYSNGTLRAALTAPATAKVGRSFTVSDATTLSDDLRYVSGVLERKTGAGSFEAIATWNGPASRGVNSGESKEESISEGGTVTYRLTVTADSGQADTCEKTVRIETTGDATLDLDWSLPSSVYEGHPALAEDRSVFTEEDLETGRTNYYTIYEAGSHSFRVNPNRNYTQTRIDRADTEFRFSVPGTYDVTINESFRSLHDSDTKSIDVLRAPAISHNLGGYQKQNRKGIITADIALNPNYPLDTWWVRIKDKATGEETILEEGHLSGETANIKTRAASFTTDVNGCYSHIRIEFLTKNPSYNAALGKGNGTNTDGTEPYTYEIYARDIRGNTDRVSRDFNVAPDIPPVAAIETEDSFIRERGTNYASLSVKDMSSTDGDSLERSWSYAAADPKTEVFGAYTEITSGSAGYVDSSFGSGQNIAFAKEGVGRVNVKLVVKDKIPANETLAEFLAPSDYLSSEAVAGTTVVNIAPTVSLEPIEAVSGETYVYKGQQVDEALFASVLSDIKSLKNELLSDAVFMDVKELSGEIVSGIAERNGALLPAGAEMLHLDYGDGRATAPNEWYKTSTGCWDAAYFAGDEDSLYVMNPNWYVSVNETRSSYAYYGVTFPFTVTAYDLKSGNEKWNTTVTQEMWGESTIYSSGPVSHFESDYLLLRTGDSTLLFQKSNGAYITSIPFVMGDYAWQRGAFVYTYRADGIYSISLERGSVHCIYSGKLLNNPKVLGDSLCFLDARDKLKLVKLDFANESIKQQVFAGDLDASKVYCAGMDIDGKVLVYDDNCLYVYADVANAPIFTSPVIGIAMQSGFVPFAVKNAKDKIEYVGYGYSSGSQTEPYNVCAIFDISTGQELRDADSSTIHGDVYVVESGFGLNFFRLLGAWDYGGGNIVINTGMAPYKMHDARKEWGFSIRRPLAYTAHFNMGAGTVWKESISTDAFRNGNTEIAGRNMGTYYVGVNADAFSPSDTDNQRTVYVRALPKEEASVSEIEVAKKVREKEASELGKALFVSLGDLGTAAREKLSNLGYSILEGAEGIKDRVKGFFKSKEENVNALLVTKTGSAASSLTRNVTLDYGREYYYEYGIFETGNDGNGRNAGALSVKENISCLKTLGGHQYLDEENGYVVTDMIYDDYRGGTANTFFTYSGGTLKPGKWAFAEEPYTVGSNPGSCGGSVSFTIPEGKEAVLMVDYEFIRWHRYGWHVISASLDGAYWNRSNESYSRSGVTINAAVHDEYEGTFVSDRTLSAGTHTFSMTGFGAFPLFKKVSLYFVEPKASLQGRNMSGELSLLESESGVSGSFKTDYPVLCYARQSGRVIEVTSSATGFGEGITNYFNVYDNGTRSWSDGPKKDKTYYVAHNWTLSLKSEYDAELFGFTGSYYNNYITTNNTKVDDRTWNIDRFATGGSSANASHRLNQAPYPAISFTMAVTNAGQKNTKLSEGKYFEKEGYLQVENRTFDGSVTLTLSSSASSWYLTKFSLYYKENGKKVYVINEEQIGERDLSDWAVTGGIKGFASYNTEKTADENAPLVYRKGENVLQKVNYSDYESDPSKTGYWIYAHEPYNDGLNAKAGIELDELGRVVRIAGEAVEPTAYTIDAAARRIAAAGGQYLLGSRINKFYEDGKYIALYFALDDTSRGISPGRNPNYDKASNIAEIPFYILGEAASAPWIENISTSPAAPKDEDSTRILIKVDDNEKDTLSLAAEVYRDRELIMTDRKRNITASGGVYPVQTTSAFTAEEGSYEVVCTVRDNTGVGVGVYRFKVGTGAKIEGMVTHTEKWESNRKAYNMAKFGEEGNFIAELSAYTRSANPRKRGVNVFWAGEAFCLTAEASGKAQSVTCTMYVDERPAAGRTRARAAEDYTVLLRNTGRKTADGEAVYEGRLEDRAFRLLGQTVPEEVRFVFTAMYAGGRAKECEARVIVDNTRPYELMHRIY